MPISNGAFNDLLYTRWVKQRAADVDKWSAAVWVMCTLKSMGDDSFRSVYSDIWVSTITAKVSSSTPVSMAEDACTRI